MENASNDSISENSQNVKREKPLSMSELENVEMILHHMNHVFENYGKMWRGGQYVEVADVASAQYSVKAVCAPQKQASCICLSARSLFIHALGYFFTLNIFRKIGASILGDFISTIFIIKAPLFVVLRLLHNMGAFDFC